MTVRLHGVCVEGVILKRDEHLSNTKYELTKRNPVLKKKYSRPIM